ncbi:MAG: adenylate/guanylate cyclase domain-containing protein [Desulfobacteraceae bacterium]|nr:adenylate/guanylate cyclase domain-containing protein [Desulfobacteraceae bacterium]
MVRENLELAILFADIAKSTHLYEVLGNKLAQKLIGQCIAIMSKVTIIHNGTVIKTIGDEIMCTFPTAMDAVSAGRDMHEALEDMPFEDKPEMAPPNIYVGIQYGPVIREEGDVFGDAVNVAARMVALAKQRQIITTQDTLDALSEDHGFEVQQIDETNVKGKSGKMAIYEVVWEQHDLTVMLDGGEDASPALKYSMEVKFGNQIVEVDENRPSITLGRQIHNDIVVNDNRVSRSHARIEYRRGKFFLIDQSTNGTYSLIQGKKSVNLRRDEAQLLGGGIIGLGREVTAESPSAVQYTIKM